MVGLCWSHDRSMRKTICAIPSVQEILLGRLFRSTCLDDCDSAGHLSHDAHHQRSHTECRFTSKRLPHSPVRSDVLLHLALVNQAVIPGLLQAFDSKLVEKPADLLDSCAGDHDHHLYWGMGSQSLQMLGRKGIDYV